ncbi:MAG: Hpt domain-containing protein [Bacteroidetes bacterium]|nr:Hpt domain-containing protein [Bacteroidota bacterium]
MSDESNIQDLDDRLLAGMLQDFLKEAPEHLDQMNLNLIQLQEDPEEEELINEIFRNVHTLKGSAGFVGLKKINEVSRKMEEVIGDVRKGCFKITAPIIDVMYEGLDVLTTLIDKAVANDGTEVGISSILKKLDGISKNTIPASEEQPDKQETESGDSHELLRLYKQSYNQLTILKHFIYSSVHLSDRESLAVLFSKQIDETMDAERNAIWLVEDGQKVVEMAHDGKLVKKDNRRVLEIESSEVLKRVIRDQLVVWSSSFAQMKDVLPEFQRPILFPIKAQPHAFGFLVVDPEELAEVEVYQFVGQFAAMILNISKLHQKVEEQRKELNEMTEILFKQNAQLSSLNHIEVDLMKATDPVHLCRIVVEAVVGELEARRAAAFLIDKSSQELIGTSESGGFQEIDSIRFSIDSEKPFMQCIESRRIVTYRDHTEKLHMGPNVLENWVIICLKGKEGPQGVLVTEVGDEDICDSISILVNHAGILLDNLMLQKRLGNGIADRLSSQ